MIGAVTDAPDPTPAPDPAPAPSGRHLVRAQELTGLHLGRTVEARSVQGQAVGPTVLVVLTHRFDRTVGLTTSPTGQLTDGTTSTVVVEGTSTVVVHPDEGLTAVSHPSA